MRSNFAIASWVACISSMIQQNFLLVFCVLLNYGVKFLRVIRGLFENIIFLLILVLPQQQSIFIQEKKTLVELFII